MYRDVQENPYDSQVSFAGEKAHSKHFKTCRIISSSFFGEQLQSLLYITGGFAFQLYLLFFLFLLFTIILAFNMKDGISEIIFENEFYFSLKFMYFFPLQNSLFKNPKIILYV